MGRGSRRSGGRKCCSWDILYERKINNNIIIIKLRDGLINLSGSNIIDMTVRDVWGGRR